MKTLNSLVAQIGFIGNDIRKQISEIEKFSLFIIGYKDEKTVNNAQKEFTLTASTQKSLLKKENTVETIDDLTKAEKKVSFVHEKCLSCREYFQTLDLDRNEKFSRMKKLFDSIGPILIKLESLILGTFSGESTKMKQYYVYWEKEMFNLLIKYEF